MNRSAVGRFWLFVLGVVTLPVMSVSEEPKSGGGKASGATAPAEKSQPDASDAKPAGQDDKQWQPLFDGKTLTNWEVTDFGGQGSVLVKEGQIVIESGQPMSGITWKGKPLPKSNYELHLEAQRVEGSDFFCALTFQIKDEPCTLVLGGWGGGVIGLSNIDGFDASENETTNYQTFEDKTWYDVRLRVTDDKVQAWLDDGMIVDVETKNTRFGVRLEVELNRPLGVATYSTVGAIRKFELRELTKDELARKN